MTNLQNPKLYVGVVLLVLFAFALRVYQLDRVPLRGDEAYTAIHWTKTPFSPEWMHLIEFEPNPGALVTYWAWSGFTGHREFAFRYLPVLANVFGLAVILALTHRLSRNQPNAWMLALLVGLLWAVNPFFIWHAQDARQYSLLTALTPLNFYLLLRASEHNTRRDWLLYAVIQTYTVYTYYIELFWVVAQGLYILTLRRRDILGRFIMVWVGITLLLIPLFVQIYYVLFVREYAGTAARAEVAALFSYFLPTLLFGQNTIPVVLGVVIVMVLTIGLIVQRRWLLLVWVFVPMLLLTIVSTQASLFRPRYVVTVVPPLLMASVFITYGVGIVILGHGEARFAPTSRNSAFYIPLLLILAMSVVSLNEVRDYYTVDASKSADWPGLVRYFETRTNARSILISDSIDPALEYYYTGPARIFFIPEDTPDPITFMPEIIAGYNAIYLLAGPRTGATAQYLQMHTQPIPGDTWPGVSQFRPWQVDLAEIQQPLDLVFGDDENGDIARLAGYSVLEDTTLILYWEALKAAEVEYSVLTHLAALEATPDAPPVAVLDHGVAGAGVSMRMWTPNTLYRDPIALPPELPPGEYTIRVGIYETGKDARLQINADSSGVYEGRYPIGTLVSNNP